MTMTEICALATNVDLLTHYTVLLLLLLVVVHTVD